MTALKDRGHPSHDSLIDQHLCRKKLPKAGERKHLKELKLIVLGTYTDLGIVPIPTG